MKKSLITLCILLILIVTFMLISNQVQTDFGTVQVELITVEADGLGEITGTLYTPNTASAGTPAPAMLLLHGYQNDKGATSSLAIELARRGYVVLAIDQYGHGTTSVGMAQRGYVNHRVTVNFGEHSVEDNTFRPMSGPVRFRVMLNFSNLSFFHDTYTHDSAGNSVRDSSMGGIYAYAALAGLDFVDETRMAVGGHSMGTWSSWSIAAAFSGTELEPRALILQAGEIFTDDVYDSENISFNNVLILQAKYEEFGSFRDFNNIVASDLPQSPLRSGFLGVPPGDGAWNMTVGDFADGSARRMELIYTNHRLVAVSSHGIALSTDWLDQATGHTSPIPSTQQTFLLNMWFSFGAMLLALAAMCALMNVLLYIPFFGSVRQIIPNRPHREKSNRQWRKGAIISVLVAGLTYPFMAQLGHGLLPLPENIFRMTIGNGFVAWYLLLIAVMLITTIRPWKKAKATDTPMDFCDLGFAGSTKPAKFDWVLFGKAALVTLIITGFVYILVEIFNRLFLLDFRIIWPFFRPFNLMRLGQFFVYIPIFAVFFLLNNSKILVQMRTAATRQQGAKAFLSCWWRNAVCMAGGIFLVCLIQYVPFFLDIGPGADLLFSPTFGGPFMSLLLIFFPQVVVLSMLCTYIQRKTGHVFVSGLTAAVLSCWIITGGSPFL